MTVAASRGDDSGPPRTTRRLVLQGLGALGAAPWLARAAEASAAAPLPLPLRLTQIVNHIGISVPDVVRSATFYSHLFDGAKIFGQEKPALRYSIDFFPGALAIGKLRETGARAHTHAFIDHFCVAAEPFDGAAWQARLEREGLRSFAGGTFVEIGGILVQLVGARRQGGKGPAGGGFKPMPPLYTGQPLVRAHGFEQLTLRVADLDASAALFRKLFGLVPHESASGRTEFRVGHIRLGLERAAAGKQPNIASFAIRVAEFDRSKVSDELQALGAKVEPSDASEKRAALRFADPDGIGCELWPV